jgi:hypothetical protein
MLNEKALKNEREVRLDKVTKPHAYFYPMAVLAYNRSNIAKNETERTFDRIIAATFCAFTLEAYLNWLGNEKIAKWKQLE